MRTGPTLQTYYNEIGNIVRQKLEKEDSDYLLQVDFDEYLNFLVDEAKWEPLLWDESQKTVETFSTKRQRRDEFYNGRTYQIEEQKLRLRIPISHHPQRSDYFKFEPSKAWVGQAEPEWKFEGDVLIHEVEATEQGVQKGIEAVSFWLGNRNKDIEAGNKQLHDRIRPVWEAKRKRLEEKQSNTEELLQKLNIPLHQDPNAKIKPIEIKSRQLRTVMEKPKATNKVESALNRSDVMSLVDFIEQYSQQFEVAPKTYRKMGEEELRDLLVGMMNANYPGSTTGETFSKLGKTDVSLRVDSGHVLICECKFWSGAKAYNNAVEQLFNYLTWRQNYGVLLHFCKLKDMTIAISEGKRAIKEHPSFASETLNTQSETRFMSRHSHPQDASKLVEVFHLFVDLSI
ncbi:hypothetical protein ES703_107231 [subsurface metagenome]